jgi:hypothetical protein
LLISQTFESTLTQYRTTEQPPLADAETAARKVIDLVRTLIATSGKPTAYTGAVNLAFIRAGGTGGEYVAGVQHATAQKWFEIDQSGTSFTLLTDGSELNASKAAKPLSPE